MEVANNRHAINKLIISIREVDNKLDNVTGSIINFSELFCYEFDIRGIQTSLTRSIVIHVFGVFNTTNECVF